MKEATEVPPSLDERDRVWTSNASAHDRYAEMHDRVASHISKKSCRRFYRGLLDEILARQHADLRGMRIVELGCGTGHLAGELVASGARAYTGVDISSNMIRKARARALGGAATFIEAPAEVFLGECAREGRTFDLALSHSFLHHLYDLSAFFDLLTRTLTSGGLYVALHEPLMRDFKGEKRPLGEAVDQLLSVLCGYDLDVQTMTSRLGLVGRMVASKVRTVRGHGCGPDRDFVDYQLNSSSGFTAWGVAGKAREAGLEVAIHMYSYYRFEFLRRCLGAIRNYWALVAGRQRRIGSN